MLAWPPAIWRCDQIDPFDATQSISTALDANGFRDDNLVTARFSVGRSISCEPGHHVRPNKKAPVSRGLNGGRGKD
jgi:hypothetical protein